VTGAATPSAQLPRAVGSEADALDSKHPRWGSDRQIVIQRMESTHTGSVSSLIQAVDPDPTADILR
jgi:hypothetical protein